LNVVMDGGAGRIQTRTGLFLIHSLANLQVPRWRKMSFRDENLKD
jgi:hypothetical protein